MADHSFWEWAQDATLSRAVAEGWTPDDCRAAVLQTSLLSYTSAPHYVQVYGHRYSPTLPDDFLHNAPWNDWTPPTTSLERFKEAQTNRTKERIDQRVRARLCASADAAGLRNSLIVYASVELDDRGKRCLRLRRGADILASMKLTSMRFVPVDGHTIELAPRPRSKNACAPPVVFLSFENAARITKFCVLLQNSVESEMETRS